MMKSVVAAAALLTLGIGSAFAGQSQSTANHGTWFITRSDQYAHPPSYTGPVPVSSADHGTWFYLRPDQYAHPPHYAHAYHYAEANASRGTSNAYVTQSRRGTWLFAPDPNAGSNS